MSPTGFVPLLIVGVPDGHEVDPQAWEALQLHAGDEYGAQVILGNADQLGAQTVPLLIGDWGGHAQADVLADLVPFLRRAFFTLDWLEEVI